MRVNRHRIKIVLLTLLIFASWGYSVYLENFAAKNYDTVSVRLEGNGVEQSDLEEAVVEAQSIDNAHTPIQVTAWNRGPRITLENKKLGTSAETRIIEIYGSMAEICPVKLLYGNFCYQDDKDGCVIDDKTAYDLFRNKNVVGNTISYEDKQYVIRGIVKSKERMVLLSDYQEDAKYLNLELIFGNMEQGEELAKSFISNYALTFDYITIIEGSFYAKLLHNTILFPSIVIWLYLLLYCGRKAYRKRSIPLQFGLYIVLFVLILVLYLGSGQFDFYYPDRFIPTRWSDFEFWSRTAKEWREKLTDFSYLLPLPKEQILKRTFLMCHLMSAVAVGGMIGLIQLLKAEK
ncbi:ABC transporter permease [Konateibacter massiliensis]|uniref:ABC transporter permease n=1 Tax=Konateibacter massiliensis TaxID=2002841 RepID=UPI000C148BBB|nr:ABC transporter permease [Konateibacter massiliensis]